MRQVADELTEDTDRLNLKADVRQGTVTNTPPPQPSMPTVTVVGTAGSTSYGYAIILVDPTYGPSPQSATKTITNGNATLSGTNYNQVAVGSVPAGQTATVLRVQGGANLGVIATGLTNGQSVNDTGISATAYAKSDNQLGMTLGTATVVKAKYLAAYTPAVNDSVYYLLFSGGDILVLGPKAQA